METERKGQRRARYIVPLLKKRPRQKQIPHCVRDDRKKRETKRVSLIFDLLCHDLKKSN